MGKIKAVIFDLDGTLVDSEPNYYTADREFLQEYGIDFTPELHKKSVGMGTFELVKWLKREHRITEPFSSMVKKKNQIYLRIARNQTRPFPEMVKLLYYLEERAYVLALASGSSKQVIDEILTGVGLEGYFKTTVSSEEVFRGKPLPDIFLEAAKRLDVAPENCFVIEDSVFGVTAAKDAGMYCAAVPSFPDESGEDVYFHADILFSEGMKGFSADQLLEFIEGVDS